MNKSILIIIGLVVILGIGAFAYKSMKQPASNGMNPSPTEAMKQTTAQAAEGTLKSLLTMGQSVQCTFSNSTANGTTSEGTVYVSNGKMRGDFKAVMEKLTVNSHMIVDGQTSYVWSDQSKQGIKMAIKQEETTQPMGTQANGSENGPNLNEKVNYSCKPWSTDSSMFALPSGITFMTFEVPSMAPSGTTTQESGTPAEGASSQCAACNSVPAGQARDACKAQFNCQ